MGTFAPENLKKLAIASSGALVVTLTIFLIMQALIAVGDVALQEKGIKIADVTMPERELELLQDTERPQEEEPPPENIPPEFDMTPPADLDNAAPRPKFDFQGRKAGVFADGSYVPIFKVPPVYPRRAQERGIEGCVQVEFTVTKVGSVRDPIVVYSQPNGIFDRSALRAAAKFKYKPQIRDGEAIEVPGINNMIIFKIEDPNKPADYIPPGCE